MHVIARPALLAAGRRHHDAADWLNQWWRTASRAKWHRLADVRHDYPSADQVDCCLVFNCRGNRYRLIVRVSYTDEYQRGTVLVKHFMTHAQYSKNAWRKDCK